MLSKESLNLSGVILAGGDIREINGVQVPFLSFHDESVLERQIRIMSTICDEIIIVTNEPRQFLPIVRDQVRVITDYYSYKGSLCGMYSALSLAKNDHCWIVANDMPLLSLEVWGSDPLLKTLNLMGLDPEMNKKGSDPHHDAVLFIKDRQLQPYHGIYHKKILQQIKGELEQGQTSTKELINKINYHSITEEELIKQGIDTKFMTELVNEEDYNNALELESFASKA